MNNVREQLKDMGKHDKETVVIKAIESFQELLKRFSMPPLAISSTVTTSPKNDTAPLDNKDDADPDSLGFHAPASPEEWATDRC